MCLPSTTNSRTECSECAAGWGRELRGNGCSILRDWETGEHYFIVEGDNKEDGEEETNLTLVGWNIM